jgi:hypothetical protein
MNIVCGVADALAVLDHADPALQTDLKAPE